MSSVLSDYERGKLEGKTEARLDEAFVRLDKINGSVERHAIASEQLASEIRELREEARARDLAVKVAADTLAQETERRRVVEEELRISRASALEVPVRKWNLWANKASVIATVAAVCFGLATLYLALR